MTPMDLRQEPCRQIAPMLATRRIIVCVGAGGVGKTTLAASIALRAAREGRRVVCLTIDPARRLADSLGVSSCAGGGELADITEVLGDTGKEGGRLSFGMLDPVSTFDGFVRKRSSAAARAEKILENKLYRYVSGSLSGMQEYMALEKLCEIADDADIELIVLDTPPTANALDFFTAPTRMTEALDGSLVRLMRRAYGGPGKPGFDLVGRWASAVLRAISRVTGAELLGEMMGFIDALSDLFGSFSTRAEAVREVLKGEDVAFCLVTTPDRSTQREATQFRKKLDGMGLSIDAVLFNRVHWPRVPAPPRGVPQSVVELNRAWNSAFDSEQALISRVQEAWRGLNSVCLVPLLPGGGSRLEGLTRIGSYL